MIAETAYLHLKGEPDHIPRLPHSIGCQRRLVNGAHSAVLPRSPPLAVNLALAQSDAPLSKLFTLAYPPPPLSRIGGGWAHSLRLASG